MGLAKWKIPRLHYLAVRASRLDFYHIYFLKLNVYYATEFQKMIELKLQKLTQVKPDCALIPINNIKEFEFVVFFE